MENNQLEEGQIVLCTVENIQGTSVFVKIEGNGEGIEGIITTSEIAPGRIRNLRDYVVPGKKIVCKVLSIKEGRIFLSLRRVKPSEKKELLDKLSKEKSYLAILKTVLGKESVSTIDKITQDYSILDFFEKIKENQKLLDEYVNKEVAEKIIKITESKKEKLKEIKQVFRLSSKSPNGIITSKNILLGSCKGSNCNLTYLAAGKYMITLSGENFKELKTVTTKVLTEIEKEAKKQHCDFLMEK